MGYGYFDGAMTLDYVITRAFMRGWQEGQSQKKQYDERREAGGGKEIARLGDATLLAFRTRMAP